MLSTKIFKMYVLFNFEVVIKLILACTADLITAAALARKPTEREYLTEERRRVQITVITAMLIHSSRIRTAKHMFILH